MDHGVTVGPIYGLIACAMAVIPGGRRRGHTPCSCTRACPRCTHRDAADDVGLIIHLSASTALSPYPNAKVCVATVEDAL